MKFLAYAAAILAGVFVSSAVSAGTTGPMKGPQKPNVLLGKEAPKGRWPAVVAILDASRKNNFDAQMCGGTLIDREFVLTSAFCLVDGRSIGFKTSQIEVLVGTQDLKKGGRRVKVEKIIKHPDFNFDTMDYDIALLKLKTAVDDITPMAMATAAEDRAGTRHGTQGVTVGWGDQSKFGNEVYPARLRQTSPYFIGFVTCNNSKYYDGELTERQMCAGTKARYKISCHGDEGGPLFAKDDEGRYTRIVGIVSGNADCSSRELPSIYTRVSRLKSWVEGQIRKHR